MQKILDCSVLPFEQVEQIFKMEWIQLLRWEAMGEYAKVFLKNDLGKGIVKFSTVYCISKCNKRHKTLD